jgi:hypothetical protein
MSRVLTAFFNSSFTQCWDSVYLGTMSHSLHFSHFSHVEEYRRVGGIDCLVIFFE